MPTISIPIVACAVCKRSNMLNTMRDCGVCKATPVCQKCIKETMSYGDFCPTCFAALREDHKQLVLDQNQHIRTTEAKGLKVVKIGFFAMIPVYIILAAIFNLAVSPTLGQPMGYVGLFAFLLVGLYGLYMIWNVHPRKRQHMPLPS